MKVLLISAFPPDPAPEANHALHLSEHLASAGIEVEVLCKKGSIAVEGPIPVTVHAEIEDWSWSDLPRLVRRLRVSRPDVVLLLYIGWVYGHHPMITFLPVICRRVLPGVPCVTQFESVDRTGPVLPVLGRAVRRLAALCAGPAGLHPLLGALSRDSARIVVLSGPHRARLLRGDPSAVDKVAVIPPPPLIRMCADDAATARDRARKTIGAATDDFVIVYWGYIYPGKGIETLFEAVHRLSNRFPRIRVAIVGGALAVPTSHWATKYYEYVRGLPGTLGIAERVTWTGNFGWDSDAGSLYMYAGDLCILPFDYGVTLNNSSLAAACVHGLPVIGTELSDGADEALLHGDNIYLCRPRDVEMLADAIEVIMGTDELRERLRGGARRLAREWHQWDVSTRRLIHVLESAAAPHPASLVEPAAGSGPLSASDRSEVAVPRQNRSAPLISIVVAAYNVGRYLAHCLDSLVNQTLKNIEIVVVDDASEDDTADVAQDYARRYPELVRVVTCERNNGLATVRNIGMRVARGEYVGFLDGDDWADIRMCEVLYQRANDDVSDVVIADATVFYEDSKTFGQFFDRQRRHALDAGLRRMPFELRREFRVMLLEPVAWTKVYRRSFLEEHALQFEDGMNSYEDVCFHFSVLLKATRISLVDEPLFFYRQNRPGQISGRTDRRIFEIFDVFDRIHRNLRAWGAPAEVWGLLMVVQLRQFDWMLRDRVRSGHRREFLRRVAGQFDAFPADAFAAVTRYVRRGDMAKLFCLRRGWRHRYEWVVKHPDSWAAAVLDVALRGRRLARIGRDVSRTLAQGMRSRTRRFARRVLNAVPMRRRLVAMEARLARLEQAALPDREPLVEIRRIDGQELLLSRPPRSQLGDVFRRVESDYYLLRTATFRDGDTVIDVGAHVGAISLYLAKKFPFITVYALEPERSNFECLQRNIALNRLSNVVPINKAIAGACGTGMLYTTPWPGPFATIDSAFARAVPGLRLVPVETTTLEEVFREFGIRECRVLKMTAPGVIRESLDALRRARAIDLLCGEVDLGECSRVHVEAASWRIARQHFWRTSARKADRIVSSWIHAMPARRETAPADQAEGASHARPS